MRRNAGAAAVLAVFFAILGISYLPRKGPESQGTAQESHKTARPPSSKPTQREASEACTQIKDRLQRFASVATLPNSCYDAHAHGISGVVLPKGPRPELQFIVAIVPNPVTTHLQLMFDALTEVIQQAAQDDNYSYDASWVPWEDTPKDYALLADQRAADELKDIQEQQPGVLIFRRGLSADTDELPNTRGLIVFLVGEQPTRGISDKQFENALAWISGLGGATPSGKYPLSILGPTFSGSLPSLARALTGESNDATVKTFQQLQVFSGSVSSELYIRWFSQFVKRHHPLTFQTTQESDDLILERFLQYIAQAGYPLEKVAILSEDDTAFGEAGGPGIAGAAPPAGGPECGKSAYESCTIHLYYPRDIASLRSAYEQQGIFSAGKQSQNPNAPSATLRGDLSEPGSSDHDTVRTYGGQLTPLAQESTLLGITEILHDRDIEFVIVRSTNPLDQIFLAQFLRRGYPSGRVVLDGADLLFSRGEEGASLRGVMMLSTYPLILREQDWTPAVSFPRNGTYRVFGVDDAEGTYIAARQLFGLYPGLKIPIHDYAPPQWALRPGRGQDEDQRPATWVTVVGHRRFWPLAVLNAETVRDGKASALLKPLENQGDGSTPPILFIGETTVLLAFCLLWAGWNLFCCWQGSYHRRPRALASFLPVPGAEHRQLVLGACAALAVLTIIIGSSLGLFSRWWDSTGGPTLAAWSMVMLGMAFAACIQNYRLPILSAQGTATKPGSGISPRMKAAMWMTILSGSYAFLFWWFLIRRLNPANEVPLHWRNANFFSGVSPLLPQVLLVAGIYGWFWFNLQGLALLGDDRPRLPTEEDLQIRVTAPPEQASVSAPATGPSPPSQKELDLSRALQGFSRERAGDPVEECARPLTAFYSLSVVVLFAVTALFFSLALRNGALRTLGDRRFGWLMFFWLSLYMAMVLADMLQLVRTWARLRDLLVSLDRLVLRRTLDALKGLSWGSIWNISGNVLEERYRVMSRQFESLGHLRNVLQDWNPASREDFAGRDEVLGKLGQCERLGRLFVAWYVRVQRGESVSSLKELDAFESGLASLAGTVMRAVLVPAWQKEKQSLLFYPSRVQGRSDAETRQTEESQTGKAVPGRDIDPHVLAAEEFFVLPYIGFIQNVLGRIRTIALGTLCVFVSATLAVSSYPFEPLPVAGGAFLLLFVVSGGALVSVYAAMHRDATLSHLTNSTPGELGGHFWLQLMAFGIGPLLGLLTTLFPSITDFVVSWMQPSAQAIK